MGNCCSSPKAPAVLEPHVVFDGEDREQRAKNAEEPNGNAASPVGVSEAQVEVNENSPAEKVENVSGELDKIAPLKEPTFVPPEPMEESRARAQSSGSNGSKVLKEIVSKKDGVKHHVYTLTKQLGRGSYSRVYLAENELNEKVAIKVVFKKRLRPSELQNMHRETAILASIEHPHVIRYVEHFEDSSKLYIITEYLAGGELFDKIVEREFFNEQDVRTVMKVLLDTVAFCHQKNIVHRDIKPENILLVTKDDSANLKLADFGFAKKVDYENYTVLQTACGTPGYVAPEILTNDTYDYRVDIWSLGVVAYILLCGYPPFRKANRQMLFEQIKGADFVFDSPWWDPVSESAKDFVSHMLKAKPEERASISQLLEHEFLTASIDRDISPMLATLKEWNAKRKVSLLRNTWKAVVTFKFMGSNRKLNTLSQSEGESGSEASAPASSDDVELSAAEVERIAKAAENLDEDEIETDDDDFLDAEDGDVEEEEEAEGVTSQSTLRQTESNESTDSSTAGFESFLSNADSMVANGNKHETEVEQQNATQIMAESLNTTQTVAPQQKVQTETEQPKTQTETEKPKTKTETDQPNTMPINSEEVKEPIQQPAASEATDGGSV